MMSWHLRLLSWWVSANLKKKASFCIFLSFCECVCVTQDCASAVCTVLTRPTFMWCFCFLDWKFISRIRFEDMENIDRNTMTQFHRKFKENFRGDLINEKFNWLRVLNAMGTILKKIIISVIVHFCFGKYSFIFVTFWTDLIYVE